MYFLDCVVPVERIRIEDGAAQLEDGYSPDAHQFIHARASDHAAGTVVLQPGKRITPPDIAVIASAGQTSIDVTAMPDIRIVSTGNELVAAGEPIEPHQVRLSNGPAIVALLERHNYTHSRHEHLADDRGVLEARIAEYLDEADVLILSGGVSMGKADFVPQVLKDLGVEVIFHRISQRPGKPMWFGKGKEGQSVFALPGNPVSTLVCCRQYVVPALRDIGGEPPPQKVFASLTQAVIFKPRLTNFLPVRTVSNATAQLLEAERLARVARVTLALLADLDRLRGYAEKELTDILRTYPDPPAEDLAGPETGVV